MFRGVLSEVLIYLSTQYGLSCNISDYYKYYPDTETLLTLARFNEADVRPALTRGFVSSIRCFHYISFLATYDWLVSSCSYSIRLLVHQGYSSVRPNVFCMSVL